MALATAGSNCSVRPSGAPTTRSGRPLLRVPDETAAASAVRRFLRTFRRPTERTNEVTSAGRSGRWGTASSRADFTDNPTGTTRLMRGLFALIRLASDSEEVYTTSARRAMKGIGAK